MRGGTLLIASEECGLVLDAQYPPAEWRSALLRISIGLTSCLGKENHREQCSSRRVVLKKDR